MIKLLKLFGWLLGILIVLILSAVILLPLFIDPNEHKDRIVAEVKEATGRDLSITGNIGLSVFPWLGLELNGLSLSNAPGFQETQFASVERAKVRVKLLPLVFQQTLEVDTVQILGLDLNLAKSKTGVTNWDDLTGKEAGKAEGEEAVDSHQGAGMLGYTIGGVAIKDAHVVWDDQSTSERYEVKGLNLETGELTPGKAVDVNLALELQSRQPAMQAKLALSGALNADPDKQQASLQGLLLELDLQGEGLPTKGVKAQLKSDLRVDHAAGTLELDNLVITSGAIVLQGDLHGSEILTAPEFAGSLKLAPFSLRKWMAELEIPVPETADASVLQKFGLSANLNADKNHVSFDKIALVLDDTNVKGDFEVLYPTTPSYRFNLDLDEIDLDRYLPPPSEASATAQGSGKPGKEEPLFPVETLKKINAEGRLHLNRLTVQKIRAEAVEVKLSAKNGHWKMNEEVGRFYDGLIKGALVLDVRGKQPQVKIEQQASRILVGPLLMSLAETDKLEGSGNLNINLSSAGQTVSQLKRSLNGSLDFNFRDGTVKGFNLAKMIRDAKAKISGEPVAISQMPPQTDFSEMSGSAVIQNGVMNNQDLLAKSPYLRVDGSGKVNLVMENLDYTIRPVVVSSAQGQGGEGLDDLVGVPIPVHLEGPWTKPKWSLDLAKVLQEQQKAKLKELEEKEKAKLKEKLDSKIQEKLPGLKDKLPGGLKGLF